MSYNGTNINKFLFCDHLKKAYYVIINYNYVSVELHNYKSMSRDESFMIVKLSIFFLAILS